MIVDKIYDEMVDQLKDAKRLVHPSDFNYVFFSSMARLAMHIRDEVPEAEDICNTVIAEVILVIDSTTGEKFEPSI